MEGVPCLSPGTSYGSQSISYDAIGNPLTYRDGMSFTWNGRQMKTANLNGTSVSYKYNADGLRTYKKVGSTVHEYEYSGGKLFYEKRGDLKFYYRYDAFGNLATITRLKANGDIFNGYVICNSRGDVEELRKENGDLFARYVYDSWGNVIHIYDANGAEITSSTNIAVQNPIRYRGYYFDAESGLYYLQSRYYDPVTGRFLNADSLVDSSDVLGFNMYAYCGNNPVARADTGGQFWDTVFDIASVVYSAVQVCLAPTVVSNWLSLGADLVSLVVPFASGGGAAVRALSKADDIYDAAKTIDNVSDVADATVDVAKASDKLNEGDKVAEKVHGNSLKSTKETIGYALKSVDTGEIMKYGETTRGVKRYTKKFYKENGVYMEPLAKGTKYDMHYWQHEQIIDFYNKNGCRTPMNKSFW